MTTTYTWSVVQMDCYPEYEGNADVVFSVHWTLTGTDDTYTGSVYGSLAVTVDAAAPFTPYADLTKAQVVGWVQSAMGAEQVAEYEAAVAGQIAAQINPPVVNPSVPWSVQ